MKLKRLKLNNFAQFTNFECEFDGKITRLVGINGSGKTTVGLTAIWAGFKGIAQKSRDGQLIGERFRFIGKKGRSADIEITLVDEKTNAEMILKRHITKDVNQISFELQTGKIDVDENWLIGLLNMSFLSAKHFASLSGEQQARALGIDVLKFDEKLETKKEEAQHLRRDLKAFGEVNEIEEIASVNISELLKERDETIEFNNDQRNKQIEIINIKERILVLENEQAELSTQFKEIEERIEKDKKYLNNLPSPVAEKDISGNDEKIANSEETNRKAQAYESYLQHTKAKGKAQTDLDENIAGQKTIIDKRFKYIQSFDFGFTGLSVDESAQLVLNEKPIRDPYFSRSELEMIVAKLHTSINPELRVRFIDDFEMFDSSNQDKILGALIDKGFQVLVAEIGNEATKENTILLRECKIVKKYDETIQESLL